MQTFDNQNPATPIQETQFDILRSIVERVFKIDDYTLGGGNLNYMIRYRGTLRVESTQAYDQLSASLRPYNITPLFRIEEGRQTILLIRGVISVRPSKTWINLVLFLLTLFSVLFTGTEYAYDGVRPTDIVEYIKTLLMNLDAGLPFAISLLGILGAHEFGHYLVARYHKTAGTLPYFLPFPLSPFGTLGAFIQLKEPPKNNRVMLDIGIAGPLAGLVIAVPVLFIGLALSPVERLPLTAVPGIGFSLEGNSILYLAIKYIVHGQLLPAPLTYHGLSPLRYWFQYFFTGTPIPFGGHDVLLNSVAWAGWAGLLVTALNLIPAGQLDGGHIIGTFLNRKSFQRLLPVILIILGILGLFWSGWWLWLVMLVFLGNTRAEPLDQITQLDKKRRILAVVGMIIFILVFTPVPLSIINGF
jgi:membrane-associated protease RseP (regulator of RpoE activity)